MDNYNTGTCLRILSYINIMRKSAKIIVLDKDNNILILRRSDTHPYWPKHYDFPGGIIETNETAEIGIERELLEETGLKADNVSLIYEKKHLLGFHRFIYISKLDTVKPKILISWEHDQAKWMTKSEIMSLKMPVGVDIFYKKVIEKIKDII